MNNTDKNTVLISGAVLAKGVGKGQKWFVVKNSEKSEWELPKTVVRKTESSVRASIRIMGELGGMNVRVIEEAGRWGGVTTVNNKVVPQRQIYYAMVLRSMTEEASIGFFNNEWLEYAKAVRRLPSKRERMVLKSARIELVKWNKLPKDEEGNLIKVKK